MPVSFLRAALVCALILVCLSSGSQATPHLVSAAARVEATISYMIRAYIIASATPSLAVSPTAVSTSIAYVPAHAPDEDLSNIAQATPVPPTPTTAPTLASTATPLPPTPTPKPTLAPKPTKGVTPIPPSAGLNLDEEKMFAMINAERAQTNLKPLEIDMNFQAVAHARSADMAARKYYSHNDPITGERLSKTMLLSFGVAVPSGENFYASWPYNGDFVAKAMNWLMNDPPHHDNILSPRWTVVGVGVVVASGNMGISTQVFGAR